MGTSDQPPRVALETTLLVHGVPRDGAMGLADELGRIIESRGASPAVVGIVRGRPVCGMTRERLAAMLDAAAAPVKVNNANLGLTMHRGRDGATTVGATMQIAAAAGVRVFATGGIGGVHRGSGGGSMDISGDLVAMTRFGVAVVTSGVKSILDVAATREALETLGVPVVGYRTDHFPAFYLRMWDEAVRVDERFDDAADLAAFAAFELERTGRGVVVCNPIPAEHELDRARWEDWLAQAAHLAERAGVTGRDVTPYVLSRLHEVSGGATLRANVELVKSNADLAARIASAMPG